MAEVFTAEGRGKGCPVYFFKEGRLMEPGFVRGKRVAALPQGGRRKGPCLSTIVEQVGEIKKTFFGGGRRKNVGTFRTKKRKILLRAEGKESRKGHRKAISLKRRTKVDKPSFASNGRGESGVLKGPALLKPTREKGRERTRHSDP